jgi:CubicO group peptidase (beta-lactamase class C family)
MLRLNRIVLLTLSAVIIASCAYQRTAPKPAIAVATEIDALVSQYLSETGLPVGIGIAVYTPDGTYSRGFGQANSSGEPVNADTAFYIASSTKSVVALAMNSLHQQGKINLDASLAEFAPGSPLPAAIQPQTVTLRDLLTHTSGISNNAIALRSAYTGEHTPQQLWQLLASSTVNPEAAKGQFDYTNTGYNILTILTDRQLNTSWQQIVNQEILQPAQMSRTTAYTSQAKKQNWPLASPLILSDDASSLTPMRLEKQDATMHSAGGMLMSSADAARWLELMIRNGAIGNKQILPADVVKQTYQPLANVDQTFGPYQRQSYGLGWYLSQYVAEKMVQHFGSFSGFRAHVSFLPEHQVGVAVFTNEALTGSFLPDALANFIYDSLIGQPTDTSARATELAQKFHKLSALYSKSQQKLAQRQWALTLPPEHYAGNYVSAELGTLHITAEPLQARLGALNAVATAYPKPDTMRVTMTPPSGDVITFELTNGQVQSATLFNTRFDKQ